jgi:catechol 2,3-dioxygenase
MPGLDPGARIGRVRFRVADIERSLEFYRDVLGFDVAGRAHGLAALKVPDANGTSGNELIVLEERPGIHHRPRRPVTTGLYHVAILFPERGALGRVLRRLTETQYQIRGASDHAVSESVYLDDPDGNGLELYADRPREQWPYQGNEVQMTIEPFDLDGVMREAGDGTVPWRLPVETKVGHVHFTVSSLEAAERFYCGALGFDVTQRTLAGILAVSAGGYHHHVNLNVWAGPAAPRDRDDVAGLIEWELVLESEEARREVERRLTGAGYAFQRDEAAVRAADDDGNVVVVRGA